MKRIENHKTFETEILLIEKINSWDQFDVKLNDHERMSAKLTKNGTELELEVAERLNTNDDTATKISFTADSVLYETGRLDYKSSNSKISVDFPASFITTFKIGTLQSEGFKSHGTFRTFYPVDLNEIRTFHYEFETVTYQSEKYNHAYVCLRIDLNGIHYDIVQFKTETQGYYIFENLGKETFENYLDACFSIKQALGFINKLMPGSEEYIFDSSGKLYYSNFVRPTLKGMYQPLSYNPYSFLEVGRVIADEFNGKLNRISLDVLSALTTKIHTSSDFSTAVLVILEATASRSLLLIPSSFAVIIELLSKAIDINEAGIEVPIEDRDLKKKIIEELHGVIDDHSDYLTDESVLKLKRRLNEINKPINKQHLTNNEKLTRPFEQLGLCLTLKDIEIIEHRNDLLHGNILLRKETSQSNESINLYMSYVSAKLYTLISKLILKSIGYNGYVYNNAKHLEKHLEISTEDEYFEKI
ncbi:MAG: hypothetical protein ACO1N0_12105 [Fluviicola sp.]